MELMLSDGSYVAANSGGLKSVSGVDEIVQRIIMKLTAPRGFFDIIPDYGSRLHTLHKYKPSERPAIAKQFIAEALADEPGVTVSNLELDYADDSILITLYLNYADELLTIRTKI